MKTPITVKVLYRNRAYNARFADKMASSTGTAAAAVRVLARKIFGTGTHLVRETERLSNNETLWEITPEAH